MKSLCIFLLCLLMSYPSNILGQARKDRPSGLALTVINDSAYSWRALSTPHFRLHYLAKTYAAVHLRELASGLEDARTNALKILEEGAFDSKIDVLFFSSPEEIERFTHKLVRARSDESSRTILLAVTAPVKFAIRQEVMRVISYNLWRSPNEAANNGFMSQGLATWAGSPCGEKSVDEIAAYILKGGKPVEIDSLATRFGAYPDTTSSFQAASFLGYLIRTFGTAKLHALWTEGFEEFPAVFGKDLKAVSSEWRTKLLKDYPSPKVEWNRITEKGCDQ